MVNHADVVVLLLRKKCSKFVTKWADVEEIIDLYAEIPSFHEKYSGLPKQLPPSLTDGAWGSVLQPESAFV